MRERENNEAEELGRVVVFIHFKNMYMILKILSDFKEKQGF